MSREEAQRTVWVGNIRMSEAKEEHVSELMGAVGKVVKVNVRSVLRPLLSLPT